MAKINSLYGSLETFNGIRMRLVRNASMDEELYYGRYELAASASDTSVSIAPITTVSVLAITSDVAITYKLNGSSDSITLNAGGWHILHGTSITSISLSEANGSAAVVEIYLGGT